MAGAEVMRDLIERLEREGASRELDAMITVAIDLRPDWLKNSDGELWIDQSDSLSSPTIRFRDSCIKRRGPGNPPAYDRTNDYPKFTASVDAALTLVPEGWHWSISGPDDCVRRFFGAVQECQADWKTSTRPDAEAYCRHTDAAIALCIAILKARGGERG